MSFPFEMQNSRVPLTLIVATTSNLGIGLRGQLPWRLKAEMQYFARVTSRIQPSFQGLKSTRPVQNAVIMGRKTWMSIPPKFRPLKNRLNVVLSRQAPPLDFSIKDGAVWATSLEEALNLLQRLHFEPDDDNADGLPHVARSFVIGGAEVYREALESDQADSVLLTRVHGDWECDAFFPVELDKSESWERKDVVELQEFTGEEDLGDGTVKEGDIEFEYRLYCRKS